MEFITVSAKECTTTEDNGFFEKMCREAIGELASGRKSWKDMDTNTIVLACFGLLSNSLAHRLARPLWWFAGSVCAAVIGYLVKAFLGG